MIGKTVCDHEVKSEIFANKMPASRRRNPNQHIPIDPALFGLQNSPAIGSQYPRHDLSGLGNHNLPSSVLPGSSASSINLLERYPRHDLSGLGNNTLPSSVLPGSITSLPNLQGRTDTATHAPRANVINATQSSKKRTSAEAGLSANAEDNHEDVTSRRSTKRSTRTKVTSKHNGAGDEAEEKVRKVSKLNAKIAEGKGPKKGAHGPNGEVRIREDGRMEFRDADFREWSKPMHSKHYV